MSYYLLPRNDGESQTGQWIQYFVLGEWLRPGIGSFVSSEPHTDITDDKVEPCITTTSCHEMMDKVKQVSVSITLFQKFLVGA